jgi:hypothetical protein
LISGSELPDETPVVYVASAGRSGAINGPSACVTLAVHFVVLSSIIPGGFSIAFPGREAITVRPPKTSDHCRNSL